VDDFRRSGRAHGRAFTVTRLMGLVAAIATSLASIVAPAAAQKVPIPIVQEALIKATLLTFNDANITGNYDVLHAKLSKPFRDTFSPEQLKETFGIFAQRHVDLKIVAAKSPIPAQEPSVTENGVLLLYGYFDTVPSHVYYELEFIMSDGDWKPLRIDVNIKRPEER
jgi:hypothetical protein